MEYVYVEQTQYGIEKTKLEHHNISFKDVAGAKEIPSSALLQYSHKTWQSSQRLSRGCELR